MSVLEMVYGDVKYIYSDCTVTKAGVAYDPTTDVVKWAFLPVGSPLSGATWTTGSWETVGSVHSARILVAAVVGVGADIVLPIGNYTAYYQVTDSPEAPRIPCGTVSVQPA